MLQYFTLVRIGYSTQNFMIVDTQIMYRCREMSNQNGSFNRCAETGRSIDLEQEVHNGER